MRGKKAAHLVEYEGFTNVHPGLDAGLARPAVQRGLKIPSRC